MMAHREPEFMRELHRIREKLARADEKLTMKERIDQARKDSDWIRAEVAKAKRQRKAS